MSDPTRRFSDRAEAYAQYRPSYPPALVAKLAGRARLTANSTVADVGAGTGIFTALLLPLAGRVYAVEPNAAMRAAAEEQFRGNPRFTSVAAPAEATTLPDASVDLVTVAQAFHWFDHQAFRRECVRILRPNGQVGLVWNERLAASSPFMADYERLLKTKARNYDQVKHSLVDEVVIRAFFHPGTFEEIARPNPQSFDLPGIIGRAASSSYVPNVGQAGHQEFMADLTILFQRHAQNGRLVINHSTRLFLGRLS